MPLLNLFAIAFLVAFGFSFQHGYMITVLNNPHQVFAEFLNRTTNYQMSQSKLTTLWSVIVMARGPGQFLGALAACPLADSLGRKGSFLLLCIPLFLSTALQSSTYYTDWWPGLIIGRFIEGIACGIVLVLAPVFLCEIAPVHLRGALGTVHHILIGFGSLVGFCVGIPDIFGTRERWSYLFYVPAVLALAYSIITPFIKESPKFLLATKRDEQAALDSILFYNNNNIKASHEELESIKAEISICNEKSTLFSVCLDKSLRESVWLTLAIGIAGCATGPAIFNSYSTKMFGEAGVSDSTAQHLSLALGVTALLADVCCTVLIEKLGRKFIVVYSTWFIVILQAACIVLQGMYYVWPQVSYLVYANTMVIFLWGTAGLSTIGVYNAVVPELFPQKARSAGKSLEVACMFAVMLTVGNLFLPLFDILGSYVYFLLLIPLTIAACYLHCSMVETKCKDISAILEELNRCKYLTQSRTIDIPNAGYFYNIVVLYTLTRVVNMTHTSPLFIARERFY